MATPAMVLLLAMGVSAAFAVGAGAAPPKKPSVPPAILPPFATPGDGGPSSVIYPPEDIRLRFDHKLHTDLGAKCTRCHAGALTSTKVADRLIPSGKVCDECHAVSHQNLLAVTSTPSGAEGRCDKCHTNYQPGKAVERSTFPDAHLVFSHAAHAKRSIGCPQCHGRVSEVGVATREQLPRMQACVRCHMHPDSASRGDAKGACETCHLPGRAGEGKIRTEFPTGKLTPPAWLKGANHGPDFMERHRRVAGADSNLCANCHTESTCIECHDGRKRPRNIHPSDYISLHPVEARAMTRRCTSCHAEQSFCLSCHQRSGVAKSGPSVGRSTSRFHPPKAIWSDAPRKPGHHAQEAVRNLNACVSCHVERDCVACHGGRGVGGGISPHRPGFAATCGTMMRRNPRPCLVCHGSNSEALSRCR